MKPFFALAPWEYPGASFDPTPHAITRADIGGRERVIWLKMREGVIYFRDAAQWRYMFAVPCLFDGALAEDKDQLIEEWKKQIKRDNYGVFLTRHQRWAHTFATGHFFLILRSDGSGWITEFAADKWLKFSFPVSTELPLWDGNLFRKKTASIVRNAKEPFLNRVANPTLFQTVPSHWTGGGADRMIDVTRSAAQLLMQPRSRNFLSQRQLEYNCTSHGLYAPGYTRDIFSYYSADFFGEQFRQVKHLINWHFGFVGVEWKRTSDNAELVEKIEEYHWKEWLPGVDEWGKNWRGNFIGQQNETRFTAPVLSLTSQHDKLEAALTLREFLANELPGEEIEAMLRDAL